MNRNKPEKLKPSQNESGIISYDNIMLMIMMNDDNNDNDHNEYIILLCYKNRKLNLSVHVTRKSLVQEIEKVCY